MKLPYSLIKQYIDIDLAPQEIANALTLAGIEVDSIENVPPPFSKVVVAQVEKVAAHPSADKLKIATVFDGKEHKQIVCGASNCIEGIKVALAPIGAILLDKDNKPFTIKKVSLRGVESFGMLCSSPELHIPGSEEGILHLPSELELGLSLAEIVAEPIFEISLTPNLGHCLSALGIARELSAILQKPLLIPPFFLQESKTPTEKEIYIHIENSQHCPKYCARILRNVVIKPTPFWLKNKLESAGIRSINSVVDAINYTMIECGQPLHGFDMDTLSKREIVVRLSKENEELTTLDKVERKLPAGTLLITDGKKPLAIAGIMGGLESAISDATHNILLEGAYFDPMIIRKGSKKLQLRSDSSHRFERGIDPMGISYALDRAAALIQMICGGDVLQGMAQQEEKPIARKEITCRLERVKKILGQSFSLGEVESIFERLGFSIQEREKDKLRVSVPTYRNDISVEIDLIEEVARIYGYNHFEKKEPLCKPAVIPHNPEFLWNEHLRSKLVQLGLQEWITPDLISAKFVDLFVSPEKKVSVLHSKSIDYSILRPTLLPSFLSVVKTNQDQKNKDLYAFELGHVYTKEEKKIEETSSVGLLLKGDTLPYHWDTKSKLVDFFDVKGLIQDLFSTLGVTSYRFIASEHASFQLGQQALITINETPVGICGLVHPQVLAAYDIKEKVFFAELRSDVLCKEAKTQVAFEPLAQFPSTDRDWTLSWKPSIPIENFFDALRQEPTPLLEKVLLLDIYEKSQQEKNVTFRFIYRDKSRTLTFEEVEKEHNRTTERIEKYLKTIIP